MSEAETPALHVVADVSALPEAAFGPRSLIWWGIFGFMLLEGSGFILAAAVYLYLMSRGGPWPPKGDLPPDLGWSALFTMLLLLSQIPNIWVRRRAKLKDAKAVRLGILLMTLAGIGLLVVRGFELAHLNVRWSHDAYGSAVWLLMVLHTTHVLTDLGDTAVQALWLHTHEVGDSQYSEVHDNCDYWTFVVASWLPIYALVYWAPRWL